ncbi:MAG TPA: GNAT family N-acetyltransferase [Steroidobacteraceae bacterium]|jgi:GNAT superfamily N-acetyltransferase|nr:GNAT family N-acetyltransferase [Steroidobacteraceae bacterium]
MSETITIRPAEEHEVPTVLAFVRELAEYERLSNEVIATEDDMREALFGTRPYAEVVFACVDGEPVGFALFCYNFSTFLAKPGIHLEDLFVRPAYRGRGIGQRLLTWLARETIKRGCGRLEWAVLDWNEPSIRFYESLGARALKEWFTYRLTGEALEKVASRAHD